MTHLKYGSIIRKNGATKTRRFESAAICLECNGIGQIEIHDHSSRANERHFTACPVCLGSGVVIVESIVNIFPRSVIHPKTI